MHAIQPSRKNDFFFKGIQDIMNFLINNPQEHWRGNYYPVYHPIPFKGFEDLKTSSNKDEQYKKLNIIIQVMDILFGKNYRNIKVLDVGANAGFFTFSLAKKGASVTSFEPKKAYSDIAHYLTDISQLDIVWNNSPYDGTYIKDSKFDIALILSAFQWMAKGGERLEEAKKELYEISEKSDYLIFELGYNHGASCLKTNNSDHYSELIRLLDHNTKYGFYYLIGITKLWETCTRFLVLCSKKQLPMAEVKNGFHVSKEQPTHAGIMKAINKLPGSLRSPMPIPDAYKLEKINFQGGNPRTSGIFRISFNTHGKVQTNELPAMVVKGIRQESSEMPFEAQIMQDIALQEKDNPLQPPKLIHVQHEAGITWLFMEELVRSKPVIDWSDHELEKLGSALGKFNRRYTGSSLSDIGCINDHFFRKWTQNAPKQAKSFIQTLRKAGKCGYTIALQAAKELETFINSYKAWQAWIDQQPLCFCHNDPHPENIFGDIANGSLRAIDWDKSGIAPFGFDPANALWVSVAKGNFAVNEKALLNGYMRGLNDKELIRLAEVETMFAFDLIIRTLENQTFLKQWDSLCKYGKLQPSVIFNTIESLTTGARLLLAKPAAKLNRHSVQT